MATLFLKRNLSEPNMPRTLVLRGVVDDATTESVAADIYFQFADDPTMDPQFLVSGVAGKTVNVPFDFKGRDIILTMDSKTKGGESAFRDLRQATKLFFPATAVAELVSAVYDDTPDKVTLTIAGNRGTGTIRILRQVGSAAFSEIATVDFDETTYLDEPPINGDYSYKLIQDGQTGESATRTVTVDGAGTVVGTPPSALVASYDEVETVTLGWANNSGTGSNVIERKEGAAGTWADLVTLSSSATSYNDTVLQTNKNRTLYYRVKNLSTPGYSNEANVFIPRMV